mmetsp:Transcript_44219/g.82711  ORF Transcript_44219/g.82711 Transcript_44219/m.82711 type:complete len:221 (-) Transcript_44219:546-1208(-)
MGFEFVVAVLSIETLSLIYTEVKVRLFRFFKRGMVYATCNHCLLITGGSVLRCLHRKFELGFRGFQLCLRNGKFSSIQVPQIRCFVSLERGIIQALHVTDLLRVLQPFCKWKLMRYRLQGLVLDEGCELPGQLLVNQSTHLQVRDHILGFEGVVALATASDYPQNGRSLLSCARLTIMHGLQPCSQLLRAMLQCLGTGGSIWSFWNRCWLCRACGHVRFL